MKQQIAYCSKWSLPVLVDENGGVFYVPYGSIRLPFVTDEKYRLVDGHDLHSVTSKLIIAEMKVKALQKRVDENYSQEYLEKYFKEKGIDTPQVDLVNKIVTKYGDFLEETMTSSSEFGKKWSEIKSKEIPRIEKDVEYIKLFMLFMEIE